MESNRYKNSAVRSGQQQQQQQQHKRQLSESPGRYSPSPKRQARKERSESKSPSRSYSRNSYRSSYNRDRSYSRSPDEYSRSPRRNNRWSERYSRTPEGNRRSYDDRYSRSPDHFRKYSRSPTIYSKKRERTPAQGNYGRSPNRYSMSPKGKPRTPPRYRDYSRSPIRYRRNSSRDNTPRRDVNEKIYYENNTTQRNNYRDEANRGRGSNNYQRQQYQSYNNNYNNTYNNNYNNRTNYYNKNNRGRNGNYNNENYNNGRRNWVNYNDNNRQNKNCNKADNNLRNSHHSSDEEREIFLQNRLPDPETISDFREPILTWVQCPGETGIPSYDRSLLPDPNSDDEHEPPPKVPNKPDISVGYVLKEFDLSTEENEKFTTSDYVVLTDKDEILQKIRRRRKKSSQNDPDKEDNAADERPSYFTVWSISKEKYEEHLKKQDKEQNPNARNDGPSTSSSTIQRNAQSNFVQARPRIQNNYSQNSRLQFDQKKDFDVHNDQNREKKKDEEEKKPKIEKKRFTYQEFRAMKQKEMENLKKIEEQKKKVAN